jgi:hypothetical protein
MSDVVAWFDCRAGASGDMMLGALVDAGAPLDAIQAAVDGLGVEPVRITARPVTRAGLAATKVDVAPSASRVLRTWRDVRILLDTAALADAVRARAHDVFARLARAEGAAHGTSPERVHFHEVGALDSLADIVGSCAALHALRIGEATASAIGLGGGIAHGAHGPVPVPGPAVLALLREADALVHTGTDVDELCTPTGAALLASTVSRWGPLPAMRITAVGTGAGDRDPAGLPNVLRVVLGAPAIDVAGLPAREQLVCQANIDDLDPRVWPTVLSALLAAGAADAWLTPIMMKKGRPAQLLSVLVDQDRSAAVRRVIFTETSTIGLREFSVTKRELVREIRTAIVGGQDVRVKVAWLDGVVVNVAPEFDDVAAAAVALGQPVKSVLAAAAAAAAKMANGVS